MYCRCLCIAEVKRRTYFQLPVNIAAQIGPSKLCVLIYNELTEAEIKPRTFQLQGD